MLPDEKIRCHETGFQETCFKCVTEYKCRKWVQVLGTNPQTGDALSKWDCRDHWDTVLQIEQTSKINQLAASIDSLRNETVRLHTLEQLNDAEQIVHEVKKHLVFEAPVEVKRLTSDAE